MHEFGAWKDVPDNILLEIFQFLPATKLALASQVCWTWFRVAGDDYLWRELVYRKWKVSRTIGLRPGAHSWRSEYRRLVFCSPTVQSDVLRAHTDQVLHVSFSHDGCLFSTTSKDGFIKVWNMSNPVVLKYEEDMKCHSWKYTQFSQFNADDSLLLVSGVHAGEYTVKGEIAVFTLSPAFAILTTVHNKPYDIFGTWFDSRWFISGDLSRRQMWNSCTHLKVNDSLQRTSGVLPRSLYNFGNVNASSVRTVMIAHPGRGSNRVNCARSPVTELFGETDLATRNSEICDSIACEMKAASDSVHDNAMSEEADDSDAEDVTSSNVGLMSDHCASAVASERTELVDKFLIFTCGSETFTPHQIGIKRISVSDFSCLLKPDERPDDSVDHTIEMKGHIIGMNLSPDHRYLYVNIRGWPKSYHIGSLQEPPPIAQEIDIHVIDLRLMEELGVCFRGHKAFTSNEECFFIFLDVSDKYVASGAEDKQGYLWDRHYRVCLERYPHDDVVNCVAFSPSDPELLVSVSDDSTIKVWRSRHRMCRASQLCLGLAMSKSYETSVLGSPD